MFPKELLITNAISNSTILLNRKGFCVMGRRSWMEDVKVTVEVGDYLPVYEFDALREIVKNVALRVMEELEEEEKSKFPIVKAA